MRAVVQTRHGGFDALELRSVPKLQAGPGEVVLEVAASGLNRLDLLQLQGPPLIPNFTLPHIPGMDMAGVIGAVGEGVEHLSLGDRVLVKPGVHCGVCAPCWSGDDARCQATSLLGGNRPGGYAEQCIVPATHAFPIPDDVSFAQAASIPTACSTAWRGIVGTGRLSIGESVLIHAAGSGVSTFAIQIAARIGARVLVTSRSDSKLEQSRALGADVTINSASSDVVEAVMEATDGRGVDMVFDHVGPALFDQSIGSLRSGGRLVFCGTTSGATVNIVLPRLYHAGLSLIGVPTQSYNEFGDMLRQFWRLGIASVIDSEFPLDGFADALRRLDRNEFFGKIVLTPR